MPANSKTVQLADKIAELLNAQALTAITAERALAPSYTLQQIQAGEKLLVVPRRISSKVETRGASARTTTLDIGIVSRSKTETASDGYLAIIEAAEEYLASGALRLITAGTTKWSWMENEVDMPFDPEGLAESNIFEAKVSATFRRLT